MYSVRVQSSVTPGRAAEYETRMTQFFEMLRRQQGFRGGALLNSQSYPAQYEFITNWEKRQAFNAFARGQALPAFLKEHANDNLFTIISPIEGYEVVTYQRQNGNAGAAYLAFHTIEPSKVQAFQQSREQLFSIAKQSRGSVTCALSRLAGSQDRWCTYLSFLSEEDGQALAGSQQGQEWAAQHLTAYDSSPAEAQTYDVVLAHVLATAQA